MNIIEKLDCTIVSAAMDANKTEADGIITRAHELWDVGESFIVEDVYSLYPTQRESDSDEEIEAAVSHVEEQLRSIAIDGALRKMPREAVKALCEALEAADALASVKLFGREITIRALADEWNKRHTKEEIWLAPAFEK